MPLPGGARLGSSEIVSLIGAGGMGEVYRAYDPRLKRDVAIKILPQALAPEADRIARLEREAELLASVNHTRCDRIGRQTDAVWSFSRTMARVGDSAVCRRGSCEPVSLSIVSGVMNAFKSVLSADDTA